MKRPQKPLKYIVLKLLILDVFILFLTCNGKVFQQTLMALLRYHVAVDSVM